MPLAKIELPTLTIHARGPVQIGTGFALGLLDRTVARSSDGLVYVPGSALKGKAREASALLARLHDLGDCTSPHPQTMAKHKDSCIVCRMFGAPSLPAPLRWHAATLNKEWLTALRPTTSASPLRQTTTHTQVQLSRKRGMASEARLFTSEQTLESLTFVAQPALTGRLCLTPCSIANEPDIYHELILLLAGLKLINAFGGNTTRGAGECTMELPEKIRVDGREVSVSNQLANVEALVLYKDDWEAQR